MYGGDLLIDIANI